MPKLKTVTTADLEAALDAALDASGQVHSITTRMAQGYCDDVLAPIQKASAAMNASAALAELARQLLVKAAMQEQRQELEQRLRKEG